MAYPIAAVLAGSAEDPCCCTPPEDCCLYPWPGLDGDRLYPSTDLPSTVVLIFFGTPYTLTLTGDYTYSGAGPDGSEFTIFTNADVDAWQLAQALSGEDPVVFTTSVCLIFDTAGAYQVEDEFPDPLNSEFEGTPYELHRNTLCYWSGTVIHEGDEYVSDIYYMDEAPAFPPTDFYGNPWPTKPFWMFILGVGTLDQFFAKDDPQDSPTGTYGSGAITVT